MICLKTLLRIALPFIAVVLLWTRPAFALAPAQLAVYGLPSAAAVASATGAAGAGAAAGSVDLLGALAFVAAGAYMSYIAIDYLVGDQHEVMRVPLTASSPVPAPSAPPSASPQSSTRYHVYIDWFNQTYSGESFYAACASVPWANNNATFQGINSAGTSCLYAYGTGCVAPNYCAKGVFSTSPVVSCPSGYVASSSSCVLSDPRLAKPDGACDLAVSGSALAMLSDPDCARLIDDICNSPGFACQGSQVKMTGRDVSGQPYQVVVSPAPDGGSGITIHKQRTLQNTSVVDTRIIDVAPDGQVRSVSGRTDTGIVPVDGTAPVIGNPVSPTDSVFPSDYARQGEAQRAIDTIAPSVQRMSDALTTTRTVADPVSPSDASMPGWGNTFAGLTGWQLPEHVSTCPTPSVDLSAILGPGSVYTIDGHCALISDHFSALQFAMSLVWTILALFIVLGA